MGLLATLCEQFCPERTVVDETAQEKVTALEAEVEALEGELAEYEMEVSALESELAEATNADKPAVDPSVEELSFVSNALREQDWFDEIDIWRPMNGKYRLPSQSEFEAVIDWDATDTREYEIHFYDCVDFTKAMRCLFGRKYQVNAIGTVITYSDTPHAFNIVIFESGEIRLFEPQSDRYVEAGESEMYDMTDAVVHL